MVQKQMMGEIIVNIFKMDLFKWLMEWMLFQTSFNSIFKTSVFKLHMYDPNQQELLKTLCFFIK